MSTTAEQETTEGIDWSQNHTHEAAPLAGSGPGWTTPTRAARISSRTEPLRATLTM